MGIEAALRELDNLRARQAGVNEILHLKEHVWHALYGSRSTSDELAWCKLYIRCYDTVAEQTANLSDEREAMAARLRCALALPESQESQVWRQSVGHWLWRLLECESPDQVAVDLTRWRSLTHERIRHLALFRSVMGVLRGHPEFIATLLQQEQQELYRWLTLPPMR